MIILDCNVTINIRHGIHSYERIKIVTKREVITGACMLQVLLDQVLQSIQKYNCGINDQYHQYINLMNVRVMLIWRIRKHPVLSFRLMIIRKDGKTGPL